MLAAWLSFPSLGRAIELGQSREFRSRRGRAAAQHAEGKPSARGRTIPGRMRDAAIGTIQVKAGETRAVDAVILDFA